MRLRWVTLVLLAVCAQAAHARGAMDCTLNGESVSPYNGYTTRGKTGIMKCVNPETGKPVREEEYRNGENVGLMKFYDENGTLIREYSTNEKHNVDGRERTFHPNGKLKSERFARNATTYGVSQSWFEDGRLSSRSEHDDKGKQVGLTQNWNKDGKLSRAEFFDDKSRVVAEIAFHNDGTLMRLRCGEKPVLGKGADEFCAYGAAKPLKHEMSDELKLNKRLVGYQNGRMVSVETFHEDGKPALTALREGDEWVERAFTRNGVKRLEMRALAITDFKHAVLQMQEFYRDGKLKRDHRWDKDGEILSKKRYYPTGQLASEARYFTRNDKPMAEVKQFYENGKPKSAGSFMVEKAYEREPLGGRGAAKGYLADAVGTHKHFDGDGKLYMELQFDSTGELARVREYEADGALTRDDNLPGRETREAYKVPL